MLSGSCQARTLRTGKVLLDWLQNDRFRSTVAPYSLRATDPPAISTPVTWDEVGAVATRDAPPTSLSFGLEDVLQRIGLTGDLFGAVLTDGAALPM